MYNNLDAELARIKMSKCSLAKRIGITPTTLSMKLNGKSDLSLTECIEIKKAIGSNNSIEYLFAKDERE